MRQSAPPTASSANDLTAKLILEAPKIIKGCRVWRNNVGGAYPIQSIKAIQSMLIRGDARGALDRLNKTRPLIFGGLPGIPDICGILPDGRWLGIEVKWGADRQSEDQKTCQRIFDERGAVYIVARELEQALEQLRSITA